MQGRKRVFYWVGYAASMALGFGFLFLVHPVYDLTIYFLGVVWLWNGIALLLGWDPYFARKFSPQKQEFYAQRRVPLAISRAGLGVIWMVMAYSRLSMRALPMLLVSLPTLVVHFLCYLHQVEGEGQPRCD